VDLDLIEAAEEDPEFAFYEKLSSKKEEVARQSRATAPEEPVPRKPPVEARIPLGDAVYTVQIASLDNEIKAMSLVNRLVDRGYHDAYYYKAEIGGKAYFRVRCGRFQQREEAREYSTLLAEQEGIQGFVSFVE
jgi:cell division septation protein DedD